MGELGDSHTFLCVLSYALIFWCQTFDFVTAVALQLPLLNPYLDRNASFDHGANFAVAGSTALDTSFLVARGIQPLPINIPLSAQLNWFRTLLASSCPTPAGFSHQNSPILTSVQANDLENKQMYSTYLTSIFRFTRMQN